MPLYDPRVDELERQVAALQAMSSRLVSEVVSLRVWGKRAFWLLVGMVLGTVIGG
jgi:hypothetical protein